MPLRPRHNKQYCGVCGVYVVGLSQHSTRSKSHLRLYEPIRQRIAAQRAAQRGQRQIARNNFPAREVSAPLITTTNNEQDIRGAMGFPEPS
jgi:hypothetical protein